MPTGGASCCIILTSLEVLKACEEQCFREDMIYSLHFALLYQYAKQKVSFITHFLWCRKSKIKVIKKGANKNSK